MGAELTVVAQSSQWRAAVSNPNCSDCCCGYSLGCTPSTCLALAVPVIKTAATRPPTSTLWRRARSTSCLCSARVLTMGFATSTCRPALMQAAAREKWESSGVKIMATSPGFILAIACVKVGVKFTQNKRRRAERNTQGVDMKVRVNHPARWSLCEALPTGPATHTQFFKVCQPPPPLPLTTTTTTTLPPQLAM